MTAVLICLTD